VLSAEERKWWILPLLGLVFVALLMSRLLPTTAAAVHWGATELYSIGGKFPITDAMVTNWVIALAVVFAVRRIVGSGFSAIPTRGQAALEILVEKLRPILEPVVGRRAFPHVFPFLLVLFVYILIENLSGLLPGVGTLGFVDSAGRFRYFFRPANADLNATLGLALASFFSWIYFVGRYAGPGAFFRDTFGNKARHGEVPTPAYAVLTVIFVGVGIIDIISIFFRIVSLSFRLYGNIFGGENLLGNMSGLFAYLLPVPFYFLELLIGIIQAFVFTLLTAVYVGLLTNHGGENLPQNSSKELVES
jgi:F-type H+-transporting ATPase subunit a